MRNTEVLAASRTHSVRRTASETLELAWVSEALNRVGALWAIGRKQWDGVCGVHENNQGAANW
jgi:hypothetical protein